MESLAVKYRPKNFYDVVGQDIVVTILQKQIELNKFKNCYLFCGASGCGKTTVARIFANLINNNEGCPIEIDGASNNGVDNVKQIVSQSYERAISAKYKVYIVDECHMLTIQAWNAFLKCVEEPPKYTIFIFCTTDPQKIPSTILNRCQRFNFLKVDPSLIFNRLEYICKSENFSNYKDSIEFISKNSNNQLRDAISNLEKVSDYGTEFDLNTTISVLGKLSYTKQFDLLNYLIDGDEEKLLSCLDDLSSSITDWKYFSDNILGFILEVYKYCVLNNINSTSIPSVYGEELKHVTAFENSKQYYSYVLKKVIELKEMVKTDQYPLYSIQTILLQIARCE